jgi:hypothetical protein
VSGEQRPKTSDLITFPDEAILVVSLGTQLAAVAEGVTHTGRLIASLEGSLRASVISGAAHECRLLADAIHDVARALESGGGHVKVGLASVPQPPKGFSFMTKLRIACLSVGAALLAGAATVGLATAYPKLALALTAAGGTLMALGTNLPAGQSLPQPPKTP